MNIYKITRTTFLQDLKGSDHWDTFDSAVVFAPNATEARLMHPRDGKEITKHSQSDTWTEDATKVDVQYLGTTTVDCPANKGVILSSFNAG